MSDRAPSWIKSAILSLVVLAAAVVAVAVIFRTEPEATRGGARKRTAMMVEVTTAKRADHRPIIVATGAVKAENDVMLRAQVGGEVVWRADRLTPGGYVGKRKPLLRVDPRDYQNAVAQRESTLEQAKAELQIELGRQDAARKGFELLGEEVEEREQALVLRKPQLAAAEVKVQAAAADLNQAKLDLERTTIRAPFDAHILERNANVGSQLSSGDAVARAVGIETYWVEATLPLAQMRWLTFTDEDARGSTVELRNRGSWPEGAVRRGTLDRRIGALNKETRMARVLVTVADPLARGKDAGPKPPLVIGEFLDVAIEGKEIAGSFRIAREHLRDRNTVWVMEEGVLRIRKVEVALQTRAHVYITGGLRDGDKIVTTGLSAVRDGAELRLKEGD